MDRYLVFRYSTNANVDHNAASAITAGNKQTKLPRVTPSLIENIKTYEFWKRIKTEAAMAMIMLIVPSAEPLHPTQCVQAALYTGVIVDNRRYHLFAQATAGCPILSPSLQVPGKPAMGLLGVVTTT
jgi:hypothetical protein